MYTSFLMVVDMKGIYDLDDIVIPEMFQRAHSV